MKELPQGKASMIREKVWILELNQAIIKIRILKN